MLGAPDGGREFANGLVRWDGRESRRLLGELADFMAASGGEGMLQAAGAVWVPLAARRDRGQARARDKVVIALLPWQGVSTVGLPSPPSSIAAVFGKETNPMAV